MGTAIIGMNFKNFFIFLNAAGPPEDELVFRILTKDKIPPSTGRIPVGSGELRS
jgi:hypothetical protein